MVKNIGSFLKKLDIYTLFFFASRKVNALFVIASLLLSVAWIWTTTINSWSSVAYYAIGAIALCQIGSILLGYGRLLTTLNRNHTR